MDLGILDFIILTIFIASAIYGAFKGFISQIVSIASLILGVWCAFKFSSIAASYLKSLLSAGETAIYIVSFIIIFIIVLILCNLLGKVVEKIVHLSLLGWLNRLLGILFCTLKAVVILSIIVYVIEIANKAWSIFPAEWFADSHFYIFLKSLSFKIFPYLEGIFS